MNGDDILNEFGNVSGLTRNVGASTLNASELSTLRTPATDRFSEDGYAVMHNFLEDSVRTLAHSYIVLRDAIGYGSRNDPQVPESRSFYADPLMESMLERQRPVVESIVNLSLIPTYSYLRIYNTGQNLPAHVDRPSCEISVTTCLGVEYAHGADDSAWPIFVQSPDGSSEEARPICLSLGDALVYRGPEVRHWREPFSGIRQIQVFLHYVDANGNNRECAFDGRPSLGLPASMRGVT